MRAAAERWRARLAAQALADEEAAQQAEALARLRAEEDARRRREELLRRAVPPRRRPLQPRNGSKGSPAMAQSLVGPGA